MNINGERSRISNIGVPKTHGDFSAASPAA
jgi:hypothetical protein